MRKKSLFKKFELINNSRVYIILHPIKLFLRPTNGWNSNFHFCFCFLFFNVYGGCSPKSRTKSRFHKRGGEGGAGDAPVFSSPLPTLFRHLSSSFSSASRLQEKEEKAKRDAKCRRRRQEKEAISVPFSLEALILFWLSAGHGRFSKAVFGS